MDKDYLKRLEEVAKMAKYDYMDLSDILPENNNNLSNTIRYRDLMEESAANELLKNTGVSVPDIKTANRDQIEKFANDLLQENYGSDFIHCSALSVSGIGCESIFEYQSCSS